MATAQDYPVTFGYGAKDGFWYGPNGRIGPYHRGDDRSMGTGELVLVNGEQIGLSGATGAVSGPHLHTGHFINGKDVDPKGGGFDVPGASVLATGEDATNGKWVRYGKANDYWVQLHLSRIDVKQGEPLGGMMRFTNEAQLKPYYFVLRGDDGTLAERKSWIGKTDQDFLTVARKEAAARDKELESLRKAVKAKPAGKATAKQIAAEKAVNAFKEALK